MNSRERIKTIISGQAADRCGFWLGNPHEEMWPILEKHFGTDDQKLFPKSNWEFCKWTKSDTIGFFISVGLTVSILVLFWAMIKIIAG